MLALQRSAGNRAVARLLQRTGGEKQRLAPESAGPSRDRNEMLQRAGSAASRSLRTLLRQPGAADSTTSDSITSARFMGPDGRTPEPLLEACFEDRARMTVGARDSETARPVSKVQQALVDLGFDIGTTGPARDGVDGAYGPKTAHAVQEFKKREQLGFEQFGDVGPGTMRRLDALFSASAPPQPAPPGPVGPGKLLGGGGGLIPGLLAGGGFEDFLEAIRRQLEADRKRDRNRFLDLLREPRRNKGALLAALPGLEALSAKELVDAIGDRALEDLAGSPAGREVLEKFIARMPVNDARFSTQIAKVQSALDLRKKSLRRTPSTSDQQAIDRINKALSRDTVHMAQYTAGTLSTPLRFPVELRQPGLEDDGGVYWDPGLKDAGETTTSERDFAIGGTILGRAFLLTYVRLGPSALTDTDEAIRSTMFHEFTHYKRHLEFRLDEAAKSAETKFLENEQLLPGEPENAETEAASSELAEEYKTLNDKELRSVLLYLSRFIGAAIGQFRNEAIDRVLAATKKDPVGRTRIIQNIDTLRYPTDASKRKKAMKPLRDSLEKGRR